MNEKRKLRIVFPENNIEEEYVDFLSQRFDVEVLDPEAVTNTKSIDLIVFTGGEDVTPALYNEKVGMFTSTNSTRDSQEQYTYDRFYGRPKLGICRGAQLLTVLSGGKLVQHVENHSTSHEITLEGYGDLVVTSSHHQMLYPFNMSEDMFKVLGYSKFFRSGTYLNGDNEEIDTHKDFVEPEVVFYPYSQSLCIQGHPEWSHATEDFVNVSLDMVELLLDGELKKETFKFPNPKKVEKKIGVGIMDKLKSIQYYNMSGDPISAQKNIRRSAAVSDIHKSINPYELINLDTEVKSSEPNIYYKIKDEPTKEDLDWLLSDSEEDNK